MRKFLVLILSLATLMPVLTKGQSAGGSVYSFLSVVNSARISSLGGMAPAVVDNDLNLGAVNPSLLNAQVDGQLSLTWIKQFTQINYGNVYWGKKLKKAGNLSLGIVYGDYGHIQETDANGDETGNVRYANDVIGTAGWGRALRFKSKKGKASFDSLLNVGANLHVVYSNIADYTSVGLTADAGLTYYNRTKGLGLSFLITRLGKQIKGYYPDHLEPIKPEASLSFSKKFGKAPLRILLSYQHLEKWKLSNSDTSSTIDAFAASDKGSNKIKNVFFDNLSRHFVLGFEFLPVKNFSIRLGYNINRRRDMMVQTRKSISGFSWGIGFRISKFHLSYGNAVYSVAGATNQITMALNLNELIGRKRSYYIEGGK